MFIDHYLENQDQHIEVQCPFEACDCYESYPFCASSDRTMQSNNYAKYSAKNGYVHKTINEIKRFIGISLNC